MSKFNVDKNMHKKASAYDHELQQSRTVDQTTAQ